MIFGTILERFVERSPACVMVRGTMENIITSDMLDRIFEQTAERQYCRELLFSSIVDLLGLVATGARTSRSTTPIRLRRNGLQCRSRRCTTNCKGWRSTSLDK